VPHAASIATTLPVSDPRAAASAVPCRSEGPSIAALTRGLSAGDEAAFRAFHASYFETLFRFLLTVTRGDMHAAQEALQETLLRVARYSREFEDEEVFWSWLKAVARSAVRDGSRKHRRYLAALSRFALGKLGTGADAGAGSDSWREPLEDALSEMAAADRDLICRKYLEGASVSELATDAAITEKAIESRLFRLRRELSERVLAKLRRQ
jgi:RNA polymerase sigma-70 factor (ECF subfamily)